jgi:hypothetical protein
MEQKGGAVGKKSLVPNEKNLSSCCGMDTTTPGITVATTAIALQSASQIDSVPQLKSAEPVQQDQRKSTAADVSGGRLGDSGGDITNKTRGAQTSTCGVCMALTEGLDLCGDCGDCVGDGDDTSAGTTATVTELPHASSGATTATSNVAVPTDDLGEKSEKNLEEGSKAVPRHFASWQNVAVRKLSALHSQFVLGAHITALSAEQVGNGDGWNGCHRSSGDAASAAKTVDLGNGVKKYRIFDVICPLNPTAQHAGSKGAEVMDFCTGEVARYTPYNGVPIVVIVVGLAVEVSCPLLFQDHLINYGVIIFAHHPPPTWRPISNYKSTCLHAHIKSSIVCDWSRV